IKCRWEVRRVEQSGAAVAPQLIRCQHDRLDAAMMTSEPAQKGHLITNRSSFDCHLREVELCELRYLARIDQHCPRVAESDGIETRLAPTAHIERGRAVDRRAGWHEGGKSTAVVGIDQNNEEQIQTECREQYRKEDLCGFSPRRIAIVGVGAWLTFADLHP